MKYVAERGYTDKTLKRHVDKDENLEEIYKEAGVELTEERIKYLVEERKLYISVEDIPEGKVGDITPVDDIPEEATVVDQVNIVPEKTEENTTENIETENNNEADVKDNAGENEEESKDETSNDDSKVEETDKEKNKNKTDKSNSKNTSKTSTKNEENK